MSKAIQPTISAKRKRKMAAKASVPTVNPSPLSSLDLAKIMNHFLTVRSVVKELSVSLKRLENIMDSLFQMFEIAQTFMVGKQRAPERPPLRLIPPRPSNKPLLNLREEESRSVDSPSNSPAPFPGNIDIGQILALLQSPLVQNLLSQWMQQLHPNDHQQQKQG